MQVLSGWFDKFFCRPPKLQYSVELVDGVRQCCEIMKERGMCNDITCSDCPFLSARHFVEWKGDIISSMED